MSGCPFEVFVAPDLPSCIEGASHIVHLKGFGTGGFPSSQDVDDGDLVAEILKELGSDGVLVWDGDLFDELSFTRILDKVLKSQKLNAVAFQFSSARPNFESSWSSRLQDYPGKLHLVLLQDPAAETLSPGSDARWTYLGLEALRLTGAPKVIALGGGGVAAEEAARSLNDPNFAHVSWILYSVPKATAAATATATATAVASVDSSVDANRLVDGSGDANATQNSTSGCAELDYGRLYRRFSDEDWNRFEIRAVAGKHQGSEKAIR
eukprot:TRINITY_DN20032_c0_g1_i1.p1 TRINITY_DN20032_c0_g1~~TRINITY_DN20032_c0_g1_i1.p1  ORF type:complete len:266 (-),score=51.32 TRINITY_DN20032_c0_g1_i1:114-911(-)